MEIGTTAFPCCLVSHVMYLGSNFFPVPALEPMLWVFFAGAGSLLYSACLFCLLPELERWHVGEFCSKSKGSKRAGHIS